LSGVAHLPQARRKVKKCSIKVLDFLQMHNDDARRCASQEAAH
jgi:hypothetical protein